MVRPHRGDIVITAFQGDYGKPSPAVVVQSQLYRLDSITLCRLTSHIIYPPIAIRVSIQPGHVSGLKKPSQVMVDKIVTIHRAKVSRIVGSLAVTELRAVDDALQEILGLTRDKQ